MHGDMIGTKDKEEPHLVLDDGYGFSSLIKPKSEKNEINNGTEEELKIEDGTEDSQSKEPQSINE